MAIDYKKYPIPRVRHHVSPQSYLSAGHHHGPQEWYPPAITEAPWAEWFPNGRRPSVLDIGCGRGGFLLEHAQALPDMNILGLEIRKMLVDWIAGVVAGERLHNAHAEWYTASNGLSWIPEGSIRYATYLFADPWPKRRHLKRRLFSTAFLADVHRVLEPGGILYLASDVPDVNEHQKAVLAESGLWTVHDVHAGDPWPFPFGTDQQQFCDRKDIPYWQYYASRR